MSLSALYLIFLRYGFHTNLRLTYLVSELGRSKMVFTRQFASKLLLSLLESNTAPEKMIFDGCGVSFGFSKIQSKMDDPERSVLRVLICVSGTQNKPT